MYCGCNMNWVAASEVARLSVYCGCNMNWVAASQVARVVSVLWL